MGNITRLKTDTLIAITRHEVEQYAGTTHGAQMYALLDDTNHQYAVVIVPESEEERPAWVAVMARIVDTWVVIDEDTALDKPLSQALMVNGNVPREQIILAYKGESVPQVES